MASHRIAPAPAQRRVTAAVVHEVLENQFQFRRAVVVVSGTRRVDVIANHRPQHAPSIRAMDEAAAEFGGNHHWQVLVLSNRVDFLQGEIAERYAVFDRKHARHPCNMLRIPDETGHDVDQCDAGSSPC